MLRSSLGSPGCVRLLRCFFFSGGTLTTPECALPTSRLFSVSASSDYPIKDEPGRQWVLEVSPFSTVRAQLGCSISVHPLDPHAFPEADRAFVTLHGAQTAREPGLDDLSVRYDDQKQELLISGQKESSSVSIDLAAPIKSSGCPVAKPPSMVGDGSHCSSTQTCFCQICSSPLEERAVCR